MEIVVSQEQISEGIFARGLRRGLVPAPVGQVRHVAIDLFEGIEQ